MLGHVGQVCKDRHGQVGLPPSQPLQVGRLAKAGIRQLWRPALHRCGLYLLERLFHLVLEPPEAKGTDHQLFIVGQRARRLPATGHGIIQEVVLGLQLAHIGGPAVGLQLRLEHRAEPPLGLDACRVNVIAV